MYVHSLCFEQNITYGNKISAYWKNGRRGWIDLDYSYYSHIQGGGREFFFFTRGWAPASHPLCLRPCLYQQSRIVYIYSWGQRVEQCVSSNFHAHQIVFFLFLFCLELLIIHIKLGTPSYLLTFSFILEVFFGACVREETGLWNCSNSLCLGQIGNQV